MKMVLKDVESRLNRDILIVNVYDWYVLMLIWYFIGSWYLVGRYYY